MRTGRFPAILLMLLPCAASFADPIIREPYVQLVTPDSAAIVWRTDRPVEYSASYGLAPDSASQPAPTSTISIPVSGKEQSQYEAALTGLKPGTTYYYRISDEGSMICGGPKYRFETSPERDRASAFRFFAFGCSGMGSDDQKDVIREMRAYTKSNPPGLFVHMGDLAYGSGTEKEMQKHFFDIYRSVLRDTPCWPALGNHDGHNSHSSSGTGPYFDAFVLPQNGEAGGEPSGTESYYSYDYGNAHFISLNSFDADRSGNAEMAVWLKKDLKSNQADWTIAYFHHPVYSKGSHDSDVETPLVEMRENIAPILEEGGVDMVLTAHSHTYERSMLIAGTYGTPTLPGVGILDSGDGDPKGDGAYTKQRGKVPRGGTIYAAAGTGGGGLRRIGTMPVMKKTLLEHGSLIVDIEDDTLEAVFLNSKGVIRDRFSIVKKDFSPQSERSPESASQSER